MRVTKMWRGEGGGRALAETLRLNTTLASLSLGSYELPEGGGRALAEALRLNTTVTSLNLNDNGLGEGRGRALSETLGLNTTVTSLTLDCNGLGKSKRAHREGRRVYFYSRSAISGSAAPRETEETRLFM